MKTSFSAFTSVCPERVRTYRVSSIEGKFILNLTNDKQYRERVYDIVRQIPPGRVMTYGQIAGILGESYTARTVGYVMHGAGDDVPWQRVINSQGKCSTGRLTIPMNLQHELLEAEGIEFSAAGKCDLGKYQWLAPTAENEDQPRLFVNG